MKRYFSGAKLREFRESKSLSVRQLGKMAGISGSAVNGYENNLYEPTISTLIKLAEALEILDSNLNVFFTEDLSELDNNLTSDSTGVSAGKSGAGSCEEGQSRAATTSYPGKCSTGRI